MKSCTQCHQNKTENEFFLKDKASGRLHAQCKECYKSHRSVSYAEHYAKYKQFYRARAKDRRAMLRFEFRDNMLKYLVGTSCSICSETDIRTFEFDHIDPSKKVFSISQAVRLGYRWPEVLAEIQKCRILCANCHKKHTAIQSGWYKNL